MLMTTTVLPNGEYEILGLVMGSKVRAVHVGRDIMALFKNLIGGEVKEYSELMQRVRRSALEEIVDEAVKLGANGIMGIRFSSSQVAGGMAEITVYGTAIKI